MHIFVRDFPGDDRPTSMKRMGYSMLFSMSPMTGETVKTWPFIVLGAVVVIALVLAILPLFTKKKKKDDENDTENK